MNGIRVFGYIHSIPFVFKLIKLWFYALWLHMYLFLKFVRMLVRPRPRINPHKEIVVLCRQLTFKSNSLLQCSVSCGTGIQVRSVDCTDHHGTSNTQCEPSTKPAAAQPCTTGISCNAGHGSEVSIAGMELHFIWIKNFCLPSQQDEEKLNDDPRYSSAYTDDNPPFYTQPLKHHSMAGDSMPRAERLVDQRVPSEAT